MARSSTTMKVGMNRYVDWTRFEKIALRNICRLVKGRVNLAVLEALLAAGNLDVLLLVNGAGNDGPWPRKLTAIVQKINKDTKDYYAAYTATETDEAIFKIQRLQDQVTQLKKKSVQKDAATTTSNEATTSSDAGPSTSYAAEHISIDESSEQETEDDEIQILDTSEDEDEIKIVDENEEDKIQISEEENEEDDIQILEEILLIDIKQEDVSTEKITGESDSAQAQVGPFEVDESSDCMNHEAISISSTESHKSNSYNVESSHHEQIGTEENSAAKDPSFLADPSEEPNTEKSKTQEKSKESTSNTTSEEATIVDPVEPVSDRTLLDGSYGKDSLSRTQEKSKESTSNSTSEEATFVDPVEMVSDRTLTDDSEDREIHSGEKSDSTNTFVFASTADPTFEVNDEDNMSVEDDKSEGSTSSSLNALLDSSKEDDLDNKTKKWVSKEEREAFFAGFGLELSNLTEDSLDEVAKKDTSSTPEEENIHAHVSSPEVWLSRVPEAVIHAYVSSPQVSIEKVSKAVVHAYTSNPQVYLRKLTQEAIAAAQQNTEKDEDLQFGEKEDNKERMPESTQKKEPNNNGNFQASKYAQTYTYRTKKPCVSEEGQMLVDDYNNRTVGSYKIPRRETQTEQQNPDDVSPQPSTSGFNKAVDQEDQNAGQCSSISHLRKRSHDLSDSDSDDSEVNNNSKRSWKTY